jgi:hypothetical protein
MCVEFLKIGTIGMDGSKRDKATCMSLAQKCPKDKRDGWRICSFFSTVELRLLKYKGITGMTATTA